MIGQEYFFGREDPGEEVYRKEKKIDIICESHLEGGG
jgi:hypothetical protein